MAEIVLSGFFLFGHFSGSFPNPLSATEEREALLHHAQGDTEATNTLVERNLRLVPYVAKKYINHAKDNEDLISIGTIGLIKAVKSFNPDRQVRLATYAIRCVENEILMYIRSGRKRASDIYLQDVVGVDREGNEVRVEDKIADDKESVHDQVGMQIQINRLRKIIHKVLHGRDKQVVEMRYGLTGDEEKTQREIAQQLGISRSYVSRIEKKSLARLAQAMRDGEDEL
jgi:RNA polymerase sporulation-specific sigma factor